MVLIIANWPKVIFPMGKLILTNYRKLNYIQSLMETLLLLLDGFRWRKERLWSKNGGLGQQQTPFLRDKALM
ncbi:hypothetical protein D3C76_1597260 [compost metagenome]